MTQPQDHQPDPVPDPGAAGARVPEQPGPPGPPPLRPDFTPQSPHYVPRQPGPPDPALFASETLVARGLRAPHRRDDPHPAPARPDLFGTLALAVSTVALLAATVTALIAGR